MNVLKTKDSYIPILNLLRALASLAVVFMHMQYTAGLDKLSIGKVLHFGQQGVAVFFVISGFIIPYSLWNSNYERKNFFKYIFKRSVRIDPPYLLVLFICLLFGSIYNLYAFDFLKVIFHLAYLIPFSNYDWYQSVFWTLGLEFQFYILIGLTFPFLKKQNIYYVCIVLLLIACSGYFINHSRNFILGNIHYFVLGIFCFLHKKDRINLKTTQVLIFLLSIFLMKMISITTGIVGLITCLAILHLNFKTLITDFLGKISYSLYLIHCLASEILITVFPAIQQIKPYPLFSFLVLFNIVIAYIFYLVIEKPALGWAGKIKFNR